MKQGDKMGIFNSPHNNETLVRQLDKPINAEKYSSSAFISTDEAIARELQDQINWEFNQKISLEKLQNGTSKLNILYEKYRKYENYDDYIDETFDDCDQQDNMDEFEASERTSTSTSPCGYLFSTDRSVVTKHDINLNRQRNMRRVKSLPPNVQSFNGPTSHMEIPNSVFNGLKRHFQFERHHENIRLKEKGEDKQQMLQKEKKINLHGMDQTTSGNVRSLLYRGKPCLIQVYGKIAEGKESMIYHAEAVGNEEKPPCDCALKLYKLDVHDLNLQDEYISGDYRYKGRYNSKMNKHKIIRLWAEKEMDNLILMKRHDIPCPEVIKLKNNVLVMSFIGDSYVPARTLEYANMTMEEYEQAYVQTIQNMCNMYKKALLIHADLSESNILWHKDKCYFIDVSQAVDLGHEFAFEYLKRDCTKVIRFFKKMNIEGIMTREALFKYITGHEIYDTELLRASFKTHSHLSLKGR